MEPLLSVAMDIGKRSSPKASVNKRDISVAHLLWPKAAASVIS